MIHTQLKALAADHFFAPTLNLGELITKYQRWGAQGTPLGFGVSAVAHQIGIDLLVHFGSPDQNAKYLPRLLSGEWICGIANTEGSGGTDIRSMSSRVQVKDRKALLNAEKNCFTNGPADLIFLSAWVDSEKSGAKPQMDVFLIEGSSLTQTDLRETYPGFKSGRTGKLTATAISINIKEDRLGTSGEGFRQLKFCFDLERLMISSLIQGRLEQTEKGLLQALKHRKSFGVPLWDHQWVQDKLLSLRKTAQVLRGLLELVQKDFSTAPGDFSERLRAQNGNLSLLKWIAVDEGLMAVTGAIEADGVRSLEPQNPNYDLMADLMHLKFLGGTRELQKSFLFKEILDTQPKELSNEQIRSTQKAG